MHRVIISGTGSVVFLHLKNNILGLCVCGSVLFWILDAMLDSIYKYPHHGFSYSLFMDQPVHEFYWRILISILLISLAIVIRRYLDINDRIDHNQEHQLEFAGVKQFCYVTVGRKTTSEHHVLISGTGRAGTTFLVQLLTALKLDTGFDDPTSNILPHCSAGMEINIRRANAPYIIKSPILADTLDKLLQTSHVFIDHVIIPMRDLYSAAESRRDVSRRVGGGPVDGGLWQNTKPEDVESILTLRVYTLLFALAKHNIPMTLLYFPRIVNDPEYLYNEIRFLFPNIGYKKFLRCFQSVSRPELVHVFK